MTRRMRTRGTVSDLLVQAYRLHAEAHDDDVPAWRLEDGYLTRPPRARMRALRLSCCAASASRPMRATIGPRSRTPPAVYRAGEPGLAWTPTSPPRSRNGTTRAAHDA